MLIALDTSTHWCSAGLAPLDLGEALTISRYLGTGHSAHLLMMLDELMRQRSTPMAAIDAIVVTVGPGSFTGLRIACGVAHGLALSRNLPVVPLSTLEVIAQRFVGQQHPIVGQQHPIVVCLDARMDELYCAVFDPTGLRLCDDFVAAPEQASTRVLELLDEYSPPSSCAFHGAGNGWALDATRKTPMFAFVKQCDEQAYPQPADMLRLGADRLGALGRDQWISFAAENALPVYIRNDVALDMAAQRQLRVANDQLKRSQTQERIE